MQLSDSEALGDEISAPEQLGQSVGESNGAGVWRRRRRSGKKAAKVASVVGGKYGSRRTTPPPTPSPTHPPGHFANERKTKQKAKARTAKATRKRHKLAEQCCKSSGLNVPKQAPKQQKEAAQTSASHTKQEQKEQGELGESDGFPSRRLFGSGRRRRRRRRRKKMGVIGGLSGLLKRIKPAKAAKAAKCSPPLPKKPSTKCAQPMPEPLKCPAGFIEVPCSSMNIDETKNGVRLLARAVSCACTLLPSKINQILAEARKCKVTVFKKTHWRKPIRTGHFTSSNPNGQVFKNRRRRGWGGETKSAKLEGACASVEYVGMSSTAECSVLSVVFQMTIWTTGL